MPIIDPGTSAGSAGDPANSWLMYKLLLAVPSQDSGDAGEMASTQADSGQTECVPPTPTYRLRHLLMLQPDGGISYQDLSDDARGTLANLVTGSPMPFPTSELTGLYSGDLENISAWIAAGAPMDPNCTCE
jgi:hypothetical protein